MMICLIVLNDWAHAQPLAATFEGKRIASVTFEPANQPVDLHDLAKAQVLAPGAEFHRTNVAAAIDRLFATGYYDDVRVDATPQGDEVAVRFITSPAFFVGHITVEGKVKNPPDRVALADATRMKLGAEFRVEDFSQAEQNLRRLLERNGLYNYKLHLETSDRPTDLQRDIRITIDVGKRAHYQPPAIEGDAKLTEDAIIRATGWRMRFIGHWREVTQARSRAGITGILKRYQKDDRLTAEAILGTPVFHPETRRVEEHIELIPGPRVTIRALETNVSQRTLKKYVPAFQEGTVNRDLLVQGARNLHDYFQSQGYFDATVDFNERTVDADHETVEFVISRGPRYKLVNVAIQGNRAFSEDEIRDRLFLQPAGFLRLRHGRYGEVFVRRDEESITNLYKGNGYRDVKVTTQVQKDYKGKAGDIAVTLNVDEGKRWLVAGLDFSGFETISPEKLKGQLASAEGQAFSDLSIASDRDTILTAYQKAGFPNAEFQWNVTPADQPNQVELHYTVAEGERQLVRRVIVSGVKTTRPKIVNQRLDLAEGDPLSLVRMASIQRELYQLGIFGRIDAAIQDPAGDIEYKNVLFDFNETSRYSLAIGVGAELARIGGTTSNLSQPAGSTGFSPRVSIDVSRLNFLGLGHTVTLRGRVSTLQELASISYLAPRFRNVEGRNITVTILYDLSRDVRTFSSKREEASVQISQKLSKPSTVLVRFAYRRVSTTDVAIPSLLVPQLLQPVRIGIISANYIQDRRDNPADAHRGIYNTIDAGVAASYFGSQRSFGRVLARNATYHQLTKTLVLARETSFGLIMPFQKLTGVADRDAIPLPERFFGGGNFTNRGFPENQAGPRDIGQPAGPGGPASLPTGFPLGGNALLFNNVELRFPLIGDNIGGVLFHDAGNIYSTPSKISFRTHQNSLTDFDYMVHAAGFGLRYKTPVGPVRLDLAYSINPPSFQGFKGTALQLLQCGSTASFTCTPVQQTISHFQFFFSIGQTF